MSDKTSGGTTRREVLKGSAAAFGAAVALADREGGTLHAQSIEDVPGLNTLLLAEYELIRAYETVAPSLDAPDMTDPRRAIGPAVALLVRAWLDHHRAHADALSAMIRDAQREPVSAASVIFQPPPGFRLTVLNILRLVVNREKAAAITYVRASASLRDSSSVRLAAAIGGVESQHFVVTFLMTRGVLDFGAMAATMPSEIVPRAFLSRAGDDANSLSSVTLPYVP